MGSLFTASTRAASGRDSSRRLAPKQVEKAHTDRVAQRNQQVEPALAGFKNNIVVLNTHPRSLSTHTPLGCAFCARSAFCHGTPLRLAECKRRVREGGPLQAPAEGLPKGEAALPWGRGLTASL